jgi:hypothetical protein
LIGYLTSFSLPVATSKTNPRIESLCGTKGLALMRALSSSVSARGIDGGQVWPEQAEIITRDC